MSLKEAIRKARGIDLTEEELHSTIKSLNIISNKIIHGDNMKTFLEIIQSSDDNKVLKSYTVNGVKMDFTARQFKALFKMDDKSWETIIRIDRYPNLIGTLDILRKDFVSVTVMQECGGCDGIGNYDCTGCEGTGETECSECGNIQDCEMCDDGLVDCSECGASDFDKDEVLFYCEIDLNQGELFI